MWQALAAGIIVRDDQLEQYLALLARDDHFSIASMVIPELRESTATKFDNPQQEQIMTATIEQRDKSHRIQNTQQSDFDSSEYQEEKRILLDAEMHRARILLHQSGVFGEQEEAIREWLDRRPDVL